MYMAFLKISHSAKPNPKRAYGKSSVGKHHLQIHSFVSIALTIPVRTLAQSNIS